MKNRVVAELPDDFPCASLLEFLQIPPEPRPSDLPDYLKRREDENTEDQNIRAREWGAEQKKSHANEPPYARAIAKLECSMGQLRRMGDAQISDVLGLRDTAYITKEWAVARVRALIGPASAKSAFLDVKVLTPLERSLRNEAQYRFDKPLFDEFDRAYLNKNATPRDKQWLLYSWLLHVKEYLEFHNLECRFQEYLLR